MSLDDYLGSNQNDLGTNTKGEMRMTLPEFSFREKEERAVMKIDGKEYRLCTHAVALVDLLGKTKDELEQLMAGAWSILGDFYRIEGERRREALLKYNEANPGKTYTEINNENRETLCPGRRTRIYWDLEELLQDGKISVQTTKDENGITIKKAYISKVKE